ncbi:MAG: GDSL-type esterase/lipase family protein [Oscillospiraceae bacterium]
MANNKKKDVYKRILQNDPELQLPLTDEAVRPAPVRRTPGQWLLMVIIALLAAVAVLLGVIIVQVEVLGMQSFFWVSDGAEKLAAEQTLVYEALPKSHQEILDGTLFVGDSNTVRLQYSDLVRDEQVAALEGIGIGAVQSLAFVQAPGGGKSQTVVELAAQMQPAYILITLGTNDIGNMSAPVFVQRYGEALDALQAASPNSEIVVNAIPLVCQNNGYPKLEKESIEAYNAALKQMCSDKGLRFLDCCQVLADEDGHLPREYADADGVHLSDAALAAIVNHYLDEVG